MSGIGAFIEGAFQGYQFGENVKDRKTKRKWDKEDRAWMRENRDYTREKRERDDTWMAEDRDYTRGQRSRKVRTQDQAWNDEQEEREFFDDLHQDTEDSYNSPGRRAQGRGVIDVVPSTPDTPAAPQTPGVAGVSTQGQPPGRAQAAGMPPPPQMDAPIAPMETPPPAAPQGRGPQRSNLTPESREIIRRKFAESLRTGRHFATGQPLTEQERQTFEGALANDLQSGYQPGQIAQPPAEGTAPSMPGMAPGPKGRVAPQMSGQQPAGSQPAAPPAGQSPSVEAAAATAPTPAGGRGILGKDDPVKVTPKQRERAADSFMDHYAENAVPKIVEFYLSKGQVEKAQAFDDWSKTREAKGQIRSWSKAVHAATIGDEDGFLDNLADTYNSFDDGYQVDRSKSGFSKDKDGNITGAQVTFKNTETGETFVKTFDDQQDIIEAGVYAMSPEQIFEHLYGQVEQASKIAAEQREFERKIEVEKVKRGMSDPKKDTALIASAKRDLAEEMFSTWSTLTPEEQDRLAIQRVQRNRAAGAALSDPSVSAPPPYTGQ